MTRSENMSKIRSKNTVIELLLRKKLFSLGYRYRVNFKDIYGKPDIVFIRNKVAIFCDSEFWHGKDYLEGKKPKSNTDYWYKKIERNIQRDAEVTSRLQKEGWCVLRFWGKDIMKNLDSCVNSIISALQIRK